MTIYSLRELERQEDWILFGWPIKYNSSATITLLNFFLIARIRFLSGITALHDGVLAKAKQLSLHTSTISHTFLVLSNTHLGHTEWQIYHMASSVHVNRSDTVVLE